MQDDFVRNYPSLDISILGINESGLSPAGFITDGRDLPWLVDVDANNNGQSDVWYDSWKIVYRDVAVVDRENNLVSRYNLTEHNLTDPENLAFLKQLFIDAAVTDPTSDWQSPVEPLDVNADGFVAPLDALLVINDLGVFEGGVLPPDRALQPPYVDTSGDGVVAPGDALAVINHLNFVSALDNQPQAPMSGAAVVDEPGSLLAGGGSLDLPEIGPLRAAMGQSFERAAATDVALADDGSAHGPWYPGPVRSALWFDSSLVDQDEDAEVRPSTGPAWEPVGLI